MLDRFQSVDPALMGLQCGDRVLDVGCGTGRHVLELARRPLNIVGADLSPQDILKGRYILEIMRRKREVQGRVHWVYAAGERLPFRSEAFDRVICTETLEHVPDDAALVRELTRVLKPGGVLAVSVPDEYSERLLWRISEKYVTAVGGHVRIYRRRDIVNLLRAGGLTPYAIRYRHGLETLYWLVHVLLHEDWGQLGPVAGALRRFLDSPRSRESALVNALDDVANRLLPKSIVVYARKPGAALRDEQPSSATAAARPPRSFADEVRDIVRQDPETQKRRALETLRSARFAFVSAVEALTEEEAAATGPNGFSAKQLLWHIAAWDERTAAALREIADGATSPAVLRPGGPFESPDAFNERTFEEGRDRSWQEALDRSRSAFEALIAVAESLSGARLAETEPYTWTALGLTLPAGLYLLLEDARHYAEEHRGDLPASVASPATRVR
ncbi:MAG TPA: methyltransferase domain-containing protein [Dehalococcoidia bacterium]|nr:methyltransferase domain-containing protein [Dehalococcoidia bacterium]